MDSKFEFSLSLWDFQFVLIWDIVILESEQLRRKKILQQYLRPSSESFNFNFARGHGSFRIDDNSKIRILEILIVELSVNVNTR